MKERLLEVIKAAFYRFFVCFGMLCGIGLFIMALPFILAFFSYLIFVLIVSLGFFLVIYHILDD